MIPAGSVPSFGTANRLRDWIEQGGHAIYLISGYQRDRFGSFNALWDAMGKQDHPLLEEFGIEIVDPDGITEGEITVHSRELTVDMDSNDAIAVPDRLAEPDVVLDSPDNARIVSLPVNRGRLSVIANADPIRNRNISNNDHGRLILELIELSDAHTVLFIYGKGTTFLKMLFHYAWMPLLGLAILAIFWIWKNLPRFGPVIPQIDGSTRQFTEHIEMSGRFLWRHKASASLLAPLVTYIHRTFQEKYPHVEDNVDAQIEFFEENTDLSKGEIAEALNGMPVKDPAGMTRVVKNLKLMSESL